MNTGVVAGDDNATKLPPWRVVYNVCSSERQHWNDNPTGETKQLTAIITASATNYPLNKKQAGVNVDAAARTNSVDPPALIQEFAIIMTESYGRGSDSGTQESVDSMTILKALRSHDMFAKG